MHHAAPVFALALLSLAGCGPTYSPNTYSTGAMQQAAKVEQAVVVGVRPVRVSATGTVGAATGAAAGGIVGAAVPGTDLGRALTGLGGGLFGGAVGTGVEHLGGDAKAFEYILRKPNGDLLSVTQRDKAPLALGDKVLVIAGPQARVVRDYTAPEVASGGGSPAISTAGSAAAASLAPPAPETAPKAAEPGSAVSRPVDAISPPSPPSASATPVTTSPAVRPDPN
jgi:outer membrane lipoprotein SlyB